MRCVRTSHERDRLQSDARPSDSGILAASPDRRAPRSFGATLPPAPRKWGFGSHEHSSHPCSRPERRLILKDIMCLRYTQPAVTPRRTRAADFAPAEPSSINTRFSPGSGLSHPETTMVFSKCRKLMEDGRRAGASEAPRATPRGTAPGPNPQARRPLGLSDPGGRKRPPPR